MTSTAILFLSQVNTQFLRRIQYVIKKPLQNIGIIPIKRLNETSSNKFTKIKTSD